MDTQPPVPAAEPTVVVHGGGQDAPDPVLGLELSGYFIMRSLASGAMGVVYEAIHPMIDRRVAVKVLKPEVANSVDWAERFIQEARALSAIKHRNIVEIINFGVIPDGRQYMMMEFLEGESLQTLIERDAPLMLQEALRIADEVLAGLGAAHKAGVVHRDLKPANIFLLTQSNGERIVKLVDFGLARASGVRAQSSASPEGPRDAKASIFAGTPEYISPEQALADPVGPHGDLYSLGVILFEMLSGGLPFVADSTNELLRMHCKVKAPRLNRPDLPEELADFVERLLAKEPSRRSQSADAAQAQVQRLLRVVQAQATVVGEKNPLLTREAGAERVSTRKFGDEPPPAEAPSPDKPDTEKFDRPPAPAARPLPSAPFSTRRIAIGAGVVLGLAAAAFAVSRRAEPPPRVAVVAPVVDLPPPAPAPPPPSPSVEEAPVPVPVSVEVPDDVELHPLPSPGTKPPVAKRVARQVPEKCVGDEGWRKATHQRIDELEKLALAGLPLDASLEQVAAIKGKARTLANQLKRVEGTACVQVDAELNIWRGRLKR